MKDNIIDRPDGSRFSPLFLLLTVIFCVCLIVSNLLEIKTINVGGITLTAGLLVFPISYIINDCIVEVYGFAKARYMIWVGFAMSLLMALFLQVGIWLPGDESWQYQEAMQEIFGRVPRILIASFIAFLCGSMVNAYVMSRMKARSGNRGKFSARAIASTIFGEGIDSIIFFPIAFYGVLGMDVIVMLIVSQTILKTIYEIVILPVTIQVVKWMKRVEKTDTVDKDISYKWWKINQI